MDKWDAEVRRALANKKTPTLSKADQALVNAHLEKEAAVRARVAHVRARLLRGLHVVRHLVSGGIVEFSAYVSSVAELLLQGGALEGGTRLVGREPFDTYLVRFVAFPSKGWC
jgi:hypothetical protein